MLDFHTKCSIYGFTVNKDGLLQRKGGPSFSYLTECKSLDLSNYSITALASGVFNDMAKLTFLSLLDNSISSLHPGDYINYFDYDYDYYVFIDYDYDYDYDYFDFYCDYK
eukprot:Pgem_evm1s9971